MNPNQTGRFWKCPECHRMVATRLDRCQCGVERSKWPVHIPDASSRSEAPPPERERSFLSVAWPFVAIAGLVGYIAYDRMHREQAPAVAKAPIPPAPSPVIQLPNVSVELQLPSGPRPGVPPERIVNLPASEIVPPAAAAPQVIRIEVPQHLAQQANAAATPASTDAVQQESEIDIKRRVGTAYFEHQIASLAPRADQADEAWERYLAGCRQNITSVTAVAGVADRHWLTFAGVNITATQWTEACAEAGTFFALMRQVRDGVCRAEDDARRNWILPGTRRDIRHRYRLDWDGWDRACI